MKTRNLDIQFMKFVYSCIIVIYHLAASTAVVCPGGYCGVEYFLLTAGMFLFISFEKGEEKGKIGTPAEYLFKRFMRFFPWGITAFVLSVVVDRIIIEKTTSLGAWMDYFASDIWEILMIKANGMNNNKLLLNAPAWTLSSMLIVGFFIWTFMYYYKKLFINVIMPLTLVIGFGVWTFLPSANTEAWIGFTTFGTFRTWLVFCLSYYCVVLSKRFSEVSLNKMGKSIVTVFEVLIHLFAITVIFLRAERYYQWLLLGLFMISIVIAMSGHSYMARLFGKIKFFKFLGDMSMSVYLVHTSVTRFFRYIFDIETWGYLKLIPFFVVLAIVSVIHYYGTTALVKLSSKCWNFVQKKVTE